MDQQSRLSRSKIVPKEPESAAELIYSERKRTFLASLDTILRQIGCLNRRDITKHIDDAVNLNLLSERENFISKVSNVIASESDHQRQTLDAMCKKLTEIVEKKSNYDENAQKTLSKIRLRNSKIGNSIKLAKKKVDLDDPILNLLVNEVTQLTQLRSDIGTIKSQVLSVISAFLSTLAQSRQQIKSSILNALNEANMKNEQLEIQLKAQQKSAQERERKIASLEQKVIELNDQVAFLKQQRASNTRVAQLERQLAEKNRLFDEQKKQNDAAIAELEQELEEKTLFLEEQRKSSNAQIFQLEQRLDSQLAKLNLTGLSNNDIDTLEAQIAERDKVIEQQKRNTQLHIAQLEELLENQRQRSSQLNSQLKAKESEVERMKLSLSEFESQISQKTDEITMLEAEKSMSRGAMTLAELEDIRQESQEKDEEIQQLKSQIESLNSYSQEIDTLRNNYIKKSKEADELKISAEIAQKNVIELENKNKSLIQSYKAIELKLSQGMNEQASLQSDIDHALMICQLRKKKIKILKTENQEMQNQIINFKKEIEEKDKELASYKTSKDDINLETTYLKQQLTVSMSDSERNNSMVASIKEQLSNTSAILQEKERVIRELMEANRQKSHQIESLNLQLSKLNKDAINVKSRLELINKTQQIEEQAKTIKSQEEHLKELTTSLSVTKANYKTLELTSIEQQAKIKDLTAKLKEYRQTIKQNESELSRLQDFNTELTTKQSTFSMESSAKLSQYKDESLQMTQKLEKITRKNTLLNQTLTQLQEKVKSLNSENETLKIQNLQMKAENSDMSIQLESDYKPLQLENDKLRKKVLKLTTTNQSMTENQEKLESQFTELKIHSQSTINVLEKKVSDLTAQLKKVKSDYDANLSEMEQHFENINIKLKGSNSSNNEYTAFFQELQQLFNATSFDNIIQKSTEKINECQELKKELQKMKTNTDQLSKSMFENVNKVDTLSNEKTQLSSSIDQLRQALKQAEQEKNEMKTTIDQLNDELKNEKEEHQTTKNTFNEFKDNVNGIKSIIPFDSIETLKNELTHIVEANSKVNDNISQTSTTIRNLESQITRLKKDNVNSNNSIQQKDLEIEKLKQSEKELKNEVLRISQNSNQATNELQDQLQKTKDELNLLNTTISELHEFITFSSNDEIYNAVASFAQQKDQKIDGLEYEIQKLNGSLKNNQIEMQFKDRKIKDLQAKNTKLTEEKAILKSEKQNLSKNSGDIDMKYKAALNELNEIKDRMNSIQSQVSQVIQIDSFDELATAIQDKLDLQKQKKKALKENYNNLQKKFHQTEELLNQLKQSQNDDFQSSFNTSFSSNDNDLPQKYQELKEKFEEATTKLSNMEEKYKSLEKTNANFLTHEDQNDESINELIELFGVSDKESLAESVKEMKIQNYKFTQDLEEVEAQLNELFETFPLTGDITVPITDSVMNELKEHINNLNNQDYSASLDNLDLENLSNDSFQKNFNIPHEEEEEEDNQA